MIFGLWRSKKRGIGEQLNYFWNMCPKPFSWAKNKRKLFSDGKSRGPLLARVALKSLSESYAVLFIFHPRVFSFLRTPSKFIHFTRQACSLLEGQTWAKHSEIRKCPWIHQTCFHQCLQSFTCSLSLCACWAVAVTKLNSCEANTISFVSVQVLSPQSHKPGENPKTLDLT